jgi:hypothetical protein
VEGGDGSVEKNPNVPASDLAMLSDLLDGPAEKLPTVPGSDVSMFWDVDGVPCAITPAPDGGVTVQAFDTDPPRPAAKALLPSIISGEATAISEAEFKSLRDKKRAEARSS